MAVRRVFGSGDEIPVRSRVGLDGGGGFVCVRMGKVNEWALGVVMDRSP